MSSATPPPTLVADYHALRLMAEWASSIRDREVGFFLQRGGLHLEPRLAPEDAAVLAVPAATPGRYGGIRSLSIRVEGVEAPLDLAPYGVDALVWSEAAVEKFLVPYYASFAGARAGAVVSSLFDAWNGDHGPVRPVALAHRARSAEAAPLTLSDTLAVIYREDGENGAPPTLRLAPLGAFRARHPATWTPPPPPPAPLVELGARILPASARLPTYADLRAIAEWGASMRGSVAYLAYDASPPSAGTAREGRLARIPAPGAESVDRIVLPVHTRVEIPDRPRVRSVHLASATGERMDLVGQVQADAAFTSTGAVEQLLTPYYASVRGRSAPLELRRIFRAWADEAHAPEAVRLAGARESLAMVHLPRSDWDTGPGGGTFHTASFLDHLGVVREAGTGAGLRLLSVEEAAGPESEA